MEIKRPFYTKVLFTRDTLKNILSVIQSVTIDTMLNNNWSFFLKNVTCKQGLSVNSFRSLRENSQILTVYIFSHCFQSPATLGSLIRSAYCLGAKTIITYDW